MGPREIAFLTMLAAGGHTFLDVTMARKFWKDPHLTRKVLSRLAHKGWLKRFTRGRYLLVPFEAGSERHWSEDAHVLGCALADPAAVAYWSAIRYWNWTDQFPRVIYIQTTQQKWQREMTVLGIRFRFVQVRPARFFGLTRQWQSHKPFFVTEKEKTILDSLDRMDLCGGIQEVSKAFTEAVAELDWKRVVHYLHRLKNGAVTKRLGFLLETLHTDSPEIRMAIQECAKRITKGISLFCPSAGTAGQIQRKWRLKMNCPGF